MGKNSKKTLLKRNLRKRMWKLLIDRESFPHTKLKICKDCGELRECDWNSSFTSTGIPEYKARCHDCHLKYQRKHRAKPESKLKHNKRRKKYNQRKKIKMINYLGGKCIKCGYDKCTAALTFHHKDPSAKKHEIGLIKEKKWDIIKKELDQCDLLCFNCHMERHYLEDSDGV